MTVVLGCLVILSGCVVGPHYVKPAFQAPPAYKEAAPQQAGDGSIWKPADPKDATLRGDWWQIYEEPELNALEEKLNTSNQNIAQSFQNLWLQGPRCERPAQTTPPR